MSVHAYLQPAAWRMDREERGWLMSLPGLQWEEPAGLALRETERRYLEAERQRAAKRKERIGRHGPRFGTTVHRAVGLALADPR
ncbi:MAG TPA: hypothetical protein VFV05_20755 [Methylomirabilota bacterium]|nr:hypothetical protein [Methylomirabilota bacterium]